MASGAQRELLRDPDRQLLRRWIGERSHSAVVGLAVEGETWDTSRALVNVVYRLATHVNVSVVYAINHQKWGTSLWPLAPYLILSGTD